MPKVFAYNEELDSGNTEYKLKLIGITEDKLEKRITQMKFRLREGNGECHYCIGVEDCGNPLGITEDEMKESIGVIETMVKRIEAHIIKIEYLKGIEGLIAEITINKESEDFNKMKKIMEIKIGLIGEENSGKSTLIGCLISDRKDNGKGLTRTNVFRHRHEITCGKTSSFTHQIVGFDKFGNKSNLNNGIMAPWCEIVQRSAKIINFIDMGGYSKFYSNSLKPLSSNYLDYSILMISAVSGITNTTVLFLKLSLEMKLPLIIIITKIDLINPSDLSNILPYLKTILKSQKSRKNPLLVQSKEDVVMFAKNMDEAIIPVFLVSNKTGIGLDYLNNFLSILPLLPKQTDEDALLNDDNIDEEVVSDCLGMEFHFLEIIKNHPKENAIIEGIITEGSLYKNQIYKLGPIDHKGKCPSSPHNIKVITQTKTKTFINAKVINIHCKKMSVNTATKGQFCSIEIQLLDDKNLPVTLEEGQLRTGLVLIGTEKEEIATKRIKVELWSLDSEKEIKLKKSYQPLLHIEHISQCAKFLYNGEEENIVIPAHKSIQVEMEFLYHSEYVKKNTFLIIIDGNIQLYGNIIDNK